LASTVVSPCAKSRLAGIIAGIPTFRADPRYAVPRRFFATTGIPITGDGRNESENVTLAAQDALLNMIDHLVVERGYSREQAYAVTSVAVGLRISELVDVPNVVVSAFLPLEIFVDGAE
jgi:formamidase